MTILQPPAEGIVLDRVDGGVGPNEIRAGVPVNFDLRFVHQGPNQITGVQHGWRFYSPDGADWTGLTADTIGLINKDLFDLVCQIVYRNVDGIAEDTVGFGAAIMLGPGLAPGFDDVSFRLGIGPIDESQIGRTVCFDSTWFPPAGRWLWSRTGGLGNIYPEWGGPYCFTVVDAPAYTTGDSNFVMGPLPDTLRFQCYEGGTSPTYDYFRVTDADGGLFSFAVDGGDPWVQFDKTAGMTPDSIFVTTDASTTTAGTYFSTVTVSSPDASNSPKSIVVKLTVLTPPNQGIVLDRVDGGVGYMGIRTGVPVNFDLRVINNSPYQIVGMTNAIRIHSPQGATWTQSIGDTIGLLNSSTFSLVSVVDRHSPDGVNDDSVGFGFVALFEDAGMPSGFDDVSLRVNVGPIDESQVGKQLCIDSCWFPPGREWLWSASAMPELIPAWGGPYCFDIVNAPAYPEQPPPPSSGDSLILPSLAMEPGGGVQSVVAKLSQPIKGATIPLTIPAGVSYVTIDRSGLITEDWDYTFIQVKPDSGFLFVALANSLGERIPEGTTELFRINFSAANMSCENDRIIRWDTTLMGQVSRQLTLSDTTAHPVYPGFSYLRDSVVVAPFLAGDCNADNAIDISDLVCLTDYMFNGAAAPVNINSVDNNGDCIGPDISDLVYFVDHQFLMGPAPLCGCIGIGKRSAPADEGMIVGVSYEKGNTIVTLSSPIAVRGVEFILKGADNVTPVKLVGDQVDMLSGNTTAGLHIGILDMDGPNTIPPGRTTIVQLPGIYEILDATIAPDGSHSVTPTLSANAPILPTKFELYQNYPNPFNPSTEIGFALPQAAKVRLEIFNIMGQRVKLLADQPMEAGVRSILWDGRDAVGNAVASGVYFYRLDAGQFTASRKMLLLK